jgi:predicted aspartyl protease
VGRTGRRAGRFALPVAALLAAACPTRLPPPDPATEAETVLAQLAAGDLDGAAVRVAAARRMFPADGGLCACSATVADLLWRDELAIAEWRALAGTKDRAGWSMAVVRGRLGDQLFLSGRYGEALVPLLTGQVGPDAARRRALVAVARELPFRRKQVGPLTTEQPLPDDALPEYVCSIGDVRRVFAVDTGSSMTTIATSLATAANAHVMFDAGEVPDGTGRPVPVRMAVIDQFAVGDIWLGTVPVLVVDDDRLAMRDAFGGPERPPIGVLGLDVLALFRVSIDPVRKTLSFELPRGLPESTSVQCVRSDGRCLLPVAVEGRRLWFVLDTGASNSSLTEDGLQALPGGGSRATPGFRRVRTAGGGAVVVREVHNLVLRVSEARFPGIDLPVVARPSGTLFPVHGVLGIDLLRVCRVVFDRGRARLEPAQ